MPAPKRCLFRVEGHVQGVGFRDACMRQALVLGLAGWVRNRRDGAVETLIQGPADAVARMAAWLQRGPPSARVDRVTPLQAPPDEVVGRGFECRPTV